jgi:hypothetical protein
MDPEQEAKPYRAIIDKTMGLIEANDAWSSPTVLAALIVRLAHANAMYGHFLAAAQLRYRMKRKEVYEREMQREKATATNAKQVADGEAIELERVYDEMYNVHQDTKDYLTVCMSYLKIRGIEVRLGNM